MPHACIHTRYSLGKPCSPVICAAFSRLRGSGCAACHVACRARVAVAVGELLAFVLPAAGQGWQLQAAQPELARCS